MVFFFKPRLAKASSPPPSLILLLLLFSTISVQIPLVNCRCGRVCDLAFASFIVWRGSDLTVISELFDTTISEIRRFNPQIPDQDTVIADTRLNIPFSCNCIRNEFNGHNFSYTVQTGDTYEIISGKYSNLTTVASLRTNNSFSDTNIPNNGFLNVIIDCYCGDSNINRDYGLFITYPMRVGDNLQSLASENNLTTDVIRSYNPTANFNSGNGIIFIPGRDENGTYRPITSSTDGLSGGAIAGISIGVVGILIFAACLYMIIYRKRKVREIALLSMTSDQSIQDKPLDSVGVPEGASPGLTGITVDKSVEFSYEELASATDDFSLSNKIGEGGFGAVYYAELRGEKAAIKKMDMQATREFLAELNVLTRVHHLNLVRLIGYCVEGSLFLVYEYIENGNLSQHLRGSGRDPLPWSSRVQIALDSARGLEYIHEHTVPVYIHRDIKSANILIDKTFHAKVADFGLTKLTEVGGSSLPTRLVGTFGYMPPEYAQYGDVSPKIDVYAFGVVLYELISAKEAIVKGNSSAESKGLVALFEEALSKSEPEEQLRKLVDPRLGEGYPIDSVSKMAHLAKVCTHENPQLRPTMRSIVVALMTLSSSTEEWDVGSFYRNQGLVNLMSGR